MKIFSLIIYFVLAFTCSVSAAETPKRIISLAPAMTEILYALGLGDNIIAVTTYCDYPEEAKKKPKIGGMSNPSLEAVVALKPDIVVMTTDGNPKDFQERLASLKVRTFVSEARRLPELPNGIRELGKALNVQQRAGRLADEIETRLNAYTSKYSADPALVVPLENAGASLRIPNSALRKKVLFIVWPEPLIVAGPGTVMNDALKLLGQENIASSARTTYPKYSVEEVLRQAPDVIFIGKATGMDMRSVSEGFLKRMSSVPAVRNHAVFYTSDKLYRLGPRVIQGIEEIAGYLEQGK